MSLLGRLFGDRPAPVAATAVVIDPELAATLTAQGEPLQAAVHSALRSYLAARDAPPPSDTKADGPDASAADTSDREALERVPFWLQRDGERDEALEEQLRDRVIHRRETETDRRT